MERIEIEVRKREISGKGISHRIRALGYIPAVMYGPSQEAVSLVVEPKSVRRVIMKGPKGKNTPLTLKFADSEASYNAVIKDYQADPVTRKLLHCDFFVYGEKDTIQTKVPLKFVGKSKGVEKGGRMVRHFYDVKMMGHPDDIPAAVEVDITELDLGDQLKLAEVKVPENVQLIYRHNVPVVSVHMGRGEKLEGEEGEEGEEAEEAEGTQEKAAE